MLESRKETDKIQKEVFDWVESVVFALAIVVLIFTFVFRVVRVDGTSMFPTLNHNDRVILSSAFYEPKYGDIVVITQENGFHKPLIKRVIATEGQTLDIDFEAGKVYIDGTELNEPYIAEPTHDEEDSAGLFPMVIPEGKVFCMGDNRNGSTDSRSNMVGLIDEENIMGKVHLRIYPITDFGGLYK